MEYKFDGIFYIANKKINKLMRDIDMCSDGKFICEVNHCVFYRNKIITKKYILDLIYKSFTDDKSKVFIPAIIHCGIMYKHESVRILSNGENFIVV